MRVHRTRHQRAFVQIPNRIAQDHTLSLEARGLLTYLLSLPDANGATVERIAARVPNGRRTVARAMNELIQHGYVKRARVQDPETGRWITITSVSDTPNASPSPTDRFPTVGEATSRGVGGSPKGSKTEEKNTPYPQAQDDKEPSSEGTKEGEGEKSFLNKVNREMTREAHRILTRLSLHKRLPLSDQEIDRLAPKVVPWLRKAYTSEEILQCLTQRLPEEISSVPGLISHRLKTFTPERSTSQAPKKTSQPLKRAECEVCGRPFPAGHPGGICRDCQDEMNRANTFLGAGV